MPAPKGEAQGCDGQYTTREAPAWGYATGEPPGLISMDSAVLRVGTLVLSADLAAPAAASDVEEPDRLMSGVLRRVARGRHSPHKHEPTYDGKDHVTPPVRLGSGTTDLATLRDPLLSPQTYDGCTDVPLRSGSTATVDIESRKVVAYQLGGADTTPRGVSATATLDDAAAAYPEGRQARRRGVPHLRAPDPGSPPRRQQRPRHAQHRLRPLHAGLAARRAVRRRRPDLRGMTKGSSICSFLAVRPMDRVRHKTAPGGMPGTVPGAWGQTRPRPPRTRLKMKRASATMAKITRMVHNIVRLRPVDGCGGAEKPH